MIFSKFDGDIYKSRSALFIFLVFSCIFLIVHFLFCSAFSSSRIQTLGFFHLSLLPFRWPLQKPFLMQTDSSAPRLSSERDSVYWFFK